MYLQGLHYPVFALAKLECYLNDYYMTRDGTVYSMKGGKPARLSGSKTPSGLYYTLNKRTYRADDLRKRAMAHALFADATAEFAVGSPAPVKAVVSPGSLPQAAPGRTKSATQAARLKGFVLATVGPTDKFVFGTDPVLHLTDVTAKQEATRIATLKPGTKVALLQIVGTVVVGGAVWE